MSSDKLDTPINFAISTDLWLHPSVGGGETAPGFFDFDDRVRRLSALGDHLEAYKRVVDFKAFRPDLEKSLAYTSETHGGRPLYDPVIMLKVLVIQTANNLSDKRTEFLINE